jgi:hypothetical protein
MHLTIRIRFLNTQAAEIGRKTRSLESTKNVSYRPQNISNSQFNNNWIPSNNQSQQQAVLPMEQDIELNFLTEREEIRQLEV